MSQLSLFEPCETVLVNDSRGRIVYTPGFVSAYEADHWFRELRRVVEWKAERRIMYDRERVKSRLATLPANPLDLLFKKELAAKLHIEASMSQQMRN